MQRRNVVKGMMCCVAMAALVVTAPGPTVVGAQSGAALTGVVSSAEEGMMEGVVVTARRESANFDVSVVSDAQGKYSFPRSHVQPGTYTVKMRAVGYDLMAPGPVEVPADQTATLDLKLQKTRNITTQLTSAEWLINLPGTDEQKAMVQRQMASCTYCHNLEVIVTSRHTAERFMSVITRMAKYYPDGTTYGIYEGRGRAQMADPHEQEAAEERDSWGFWPGVKKTDLAAYLATINRSGGRSLPTEFETLPRPTGKATRVIITQYDMPRPDTVPHDSDVDSQGRVWYTDQSRPFLGVLDPKTATFTEYPMPESTKPFTGGSDVQVDQDDNVWHPIIHDDVDNHFGLLHKFDTRAKKYIPSKMPTDGPNDPFFQFLAMGPDGKIWMGFGEFYRVDPKTLEMDWRFNWRQSPNRPPGAIAMGYELGVDHENNPWLLDYGGSGLVKVDVDTREIRFFPTPTPNAGPRRGQFDAQGRFWFGEYAADKMGMFDSKTETFTEYDPGIKWFFALHGLDP